MRGELVVVPIALALALLLRRLVERVGAAAAAPTWSIGDWIGAITLGFGAIFVISAFASHHSQEWYGVTTYYKHRIIVMGNWAAGSLAIGLGVIPLIGGPHRALPRAGREAEPRAAHVPLRDARAV